MADVSPTHWILTDLPDPSANHSLFIDVMYIHRYLITVTFQWDISKNETNIAKHKIDFRRARDIFEGFHVIMPASNDQGEIRELAIGLIKGGREITVVHTWRGNDIRIISARRARANERAIYWKAAK